MKDDKKSNYGKFDIRKPEGMWRKVFASTHAWEPIVDRAEGIYLYDTDGNRFIDASGGPMAMGMAHGDKRINAAISNQLEKFAYSHPTLSNIRKAELCERLSQITPGDLNTSFLSPGGGSDAIDSAIKLARQYHMVMGNKEKSLFVSHHESYHGMNIGALSLSGSFGTKQPFDPLLLRWPKVHQYSDYNRPAGISREEHGVRAAQELEEIVYWYGAEQIAAFVAAPWGCGTEYALMPPKSYWKTIREICDTYNILLIADEVVSGFGRSGKWFCMEYFDVQADMMTMGKGISSLYTPLGAVSINDRVNEPFENGAKFHHGYTSQGQPLACATALAVIDILEKDGLIENSATVGEYLHSQKDRLLAHPTVADVRGKGLFLTMELVANKETMDFFPGEAEAETHFQATGLENGIVFYSTLYGPRTPSMPKRGLPLLMAPPLCITKAQVNELLDAVDITLTKWEEKMGV